MEKGVMVRSEMDARQKRMLFGIAFLVLATVGIGLYSSWESGRTGALDSVAVGNTESQVRDKAGDPTSTSGQTWTYQTLTNDGVVSHRFTFENGRVAQVNKSSTFE